MERTKTLAEAIAIMARLRAPDGCAWDREQTFDTIKQHTLEEVYEVFDAIDRRAWSELKDELGDLLLQVLFYAQMADEAGHFAIEDVAAALNAKLIRRHPHIFPDPKWGDVQATTPAEVNRNWEAIKRAERIAARNGAEAPRTRLLDDVPRYVPALLEATKLGSRAAIVGFDWTDVSGLFRKLAEETDELKAELAAEEHDRARIEDELGDLLFTAVHLARHLKIDPEFALKKANSKFRARFTAMEDAAGLATLQEADGDELEALWRAAKLKQP